MHCSFEFEKSYEWELARAMCPKCEKETIIIEPETTQTSNEKPEIIHRRPLTDWEKKKLSWYGNERKWHDDIKGRRVLADGSIGVYDAKGNLKEVRTQKRGFQR